MDMDMDIAITMEEEPPVNFHPLLLQAFQKLGFDHPRTQQIQAVTAFVQEEKNVFVQLPTGFGKSACFQVLPLVYDLLTGSQRRHVILVICPLLAIVDSQLAFLRQVGVDACSLSALQNPETWIPEARRAQIVFSTPENLVTPKGTLKPAARDLLWSDAIRGRCVAFVLDEAHCVSKWGDHFRPEYGKMHRVHDALGVPVMALTATATPEIVKKICKDFMADRFLHLKEDPTRGNIALSTKGRKEADSSLVCLLRELGQKKEQFPRTVLFFSTFEILGEAQQQAGWYLEKHPELREMVASYHALISREVLTGILAKMTIKGGGIRLLLATSAFGMGVDVPELARVWHIGSPRDLDDYVQQIGRAGREAGSQAEAVLFNISGAAHLNPSMKMYLGNSTLCRQGVITSFFQKAAAPTLNFGRCCDICEQRKRAEEEGRN